MNKIKFCWKEAIVVLLCALGASTLFGMFGLQEAFGVIVNVGFGSILSLGLGCSLIDLYRGYSKGIWKGMGFLTHKDKLLHYLVLIALGVFLIFSEKSFDIVLGYGTLVFVATNWFISYKGKADE